MLGPATASAQVSIDECALNCADGLYLCMGYCDAMEGKARGQCVRETARACAEEFAACIFDDCVPQPPQPSLPVEIPAPPLN
jgi:hypothetical protein